MPHIIAVTGATGFVGRAVCRELVARGHAIRVLLRSPGKARVLPASGTEIIQGHLFDPSALNQLLAGVTEVVHCAGAVRGAKAGDFNRVNVEGVRNLLCAIKHQEQPARLLAMSSLAAREPHLSHYAASKHLGEQILVEEGGDIRWMALRPPAIYGPGDRELLPLFRTMARGIAPVPGSPDARFSMVFVDDLARAVTAWIGAGSGARGVHTIDDGRADGYNWHDVAEVVAELCHRRVRILRVPVGLLTLPAYVNRYASRLLGYAPMLTPEKLRELRHPNWVCNSRDLQAAIGWRPEVELAQGLRQTPGWAGYDKTSTA